MSTDEHRDWHLLGIRDRGGIARAGGRIEQTRRIVTASAIGRIYRDKRIKPRGRQRRAEERAR